MKFTIDHPDFPFEFRVKFVYAEKDFEDIGFRKAVLCFVECIGLVRLGVSVCHPNDQYKKSIGRKMALRDAIAPLPRDVRGKIWEQVGKQMRLS